MSADEFDPFIERLFGQSPVMADSAAFAAGVERRLDQGSRVRTLTLSIAGLIGGVIAVRETVAANLRFEPSASSLEVARLADTGVATFAARAQSAAESGLSDLGLGVDLSSMLGMQMFWLASAVLVAAAAAAATKLIQDV